MDLLTTFKILGRRWYVWVPIVAVTAIALIGLYPRLHPEYEATGSVLLLAPATTTESVQGKPETVRVNPLLQSNPWLPNTAEILAVYASTSAVRHNIEAQGDVVDYTVTVDSRAPIITVQDRAKTEIAAIQSVQDLLALIQDRLGGLQGALGAPSNALVSARVLTVSTSPTILRGSVYRTLFLVGLAGLILAASLALTVDGVMATRHSRAAVRPVPESAVGRSVTAAAPSPTGPSPS
jgi:hypothetical protein